MPEYVNVTTHPVDVGGRFIPAGGVVELEERAARDNVAAGVLRKLKPTPQRQAKGRRTKEVD